MCAAPFRWAGGGRPQRPPSPAPPPAPTPGCCGEGPGAVGELGGCGGRDCSGSWGPGRGEWGDSPPSLCCGWGPPLFHCTAQDAGGNLAGGGRYKYRQIVSSGTGGGEGRTPGCMEEWCLGWVPQQQRWVSASPDCLRSGDPPSSGRHPTSVGRNTTPRDPPDPLELALPIPDTPLRAWDPSPDLPRWRSCGQWCVTSWGLTKDPGAGPSSEGGGKSKTSPCIRRGWQICGVFSASQC